MISSESHLPDEVELVRFREAEGVEDCCAVLDQEGIAYRLSTDVPAMDVSSLGGGAVKGSVIVMVGGADEVKARTALLVEARSALANAVPQDYHLREFEDSELQLILREPREWGGYDVAAAECLLRERGIAFEPPSFELTAADVEERKEKVREFKAAHLLLIVLLVAFVLRMAWAVFVTRPATPWPGQQPPAAQQP
jgi:hypothetical protein